MRAVQTARRDTASMRPPAIQAERRYDRRQRHEAHTGFNEAACNTGGTLPDDGVTDEIRTGFNEAACNTGGTPPTGATADADLIMLQ